MKDAATVAIIVGEFAGTFGLGFLWEKRVLGWYIARGRKRKWRTVAVISATHLALAFAGVFAIVVAAAFTPIASSVLALVLALPYGAVVAATLPAGNGTGGPVMGTAATVKKLKAPKVAGVIAFVGGTWSWLGVGLWCGALFGGLDGLGLI